MSDVVFISDLHLHPRRSDLTERFEHFVDWALSHARAVYILGDFFHAWAGDDAMDDWAISIAHRLSQFAQKGIPVYWMVGNRDFLIGADFAKKAFVTLIDEPKCVILGTHRVLLAHGDGYCTQDKLHQWFRRLTRNRWFRRFFLSLPLSWRMSIVNRVRLSSQSRNLAYEKMQTVDEALGKDALSCEADVIIHGHTHRPMRVPHVFSGHSFEQIVLSDWEETPLILCYNESKTFYYVDFFRSVDDVSQR